MIYRPKPVQGAIYVVKTAAPRILVKCSPYNGEKGAQLAGHQILLAINKDRVD